MPAIKIHHTATSSKPWDGPGNKAALKLNQDLAYYSRAFAWREDGGDETLKATYKFIHHDVDADGNPGAANIKGCQSGIGVLNGGMGGANIPDADRQGVWDHLAAHLKDANLTPGELNSAPDSEREVRTFTLSEFRIVQEEGKTPKIKGYAAVFNKLSEPMMGFVERVAPGAFKNTIVKDDVRALFNHDPNYVLGRNTAKTLTLSEDEKGLYIEIDPPNTQWARDLQESIKRGDISQMSFSFNVIKDSWEHRKNDMSIRTLQETKLYDVSPVTFPTYPQTSVKVRDYLSAINETAVTPDKQGLSPEGKDEGSLELYKRKIDIAAVN